jgi:hypothetical protein
MSKGEIRGKKVVRRRWGASGGDEFFKCTLRVYILGLWLAEPERSDGYFTSQKLTHTYNWRGQANGVFEE